MPNYPYSFQLPPLNVQDIPNDGAVGEFLGISAGGVLDWLPVATGGGDMLKSENLSGLANYTTARTNIGLGTTDSPTFANLTLTSPSLSSSAPVTISQTWNQIGTAFTALKVNAVSTASATGSLLLDLQLGGATKFKVDKASVATLGVSAGADNSALYFGGANYSISLTRHATGLDMGVGGDNRISFGLGVGQILLSGRSSLAWSDGNVTNTGTVDTILLRGGAANLQLGAADAATPVAQTLSVQSVLAGATNTAGAAFTIDGSQGTGTGIGGDIVFRTAPAGVVSGSSVNPLSTAMIVSSAIGGGVGIGGQHFSSERLTVTSRSNISVNCATFRNSSTTAKFQFFLNSAGNSELYLGSNTLLSETGSSYFNGGNVGIGTTAPSEKLHVLGGKVLFGDATDPTGTAGNGELTLHARTLPQLNMVSNVGVNSFFGLSLKAGTSERAGLLVNMQSGEVKMGALSGAGYFPTFYSNGVEIMRFSTAGNVGIGTTSPTSKLHVVGDAVLTGDLLGTNYTIGVPTILTQSNISITNNHSGVADSAIVITPKGTGGVIFGPKPDGTATGGNARGVRGIDHQISRNAATQVASGTDALICGGNNNTASNQLSIVVGGASNNSSGYISFIGGGQLNVSSSNYSTVAGGNSNTASNTWSTVSGGQSNTASGSHSFVGGGQTNTASGAHSVVNGGQSNTASAQFSVIGGGSSNVAQSYLAGVGSGVSNISNGYASYIGGGTSHSATGAYAFIGGGTVNNATAENSMCLGGNYSLADRHGLFAHANGRFAATGDAQKTTAVFRNKTTTNSAVELFLNGTAARYTITSGKIISMLINITGTKSDGSAVAHYVRQYSIKNIGGTTSQVYAAVTVGTDNAAGTSIAISADDTNDSLKIEVTGVAAETWRWVASVDAVEVGHGV